MFYMSLNRRQFLELLSLTPAGMMLSSITAKTDEANQLNSNQLNSNQSNGSQPNVLFIAVDDLNDWIGCLGGHPQAVTPNLDALAARGTLFTQAYCPAPLCNPSRTSVLTGLLPSTSGVYWNSYERQYFRHSPALHDCVTLPQYFMQQGYHVMGAGKVFHYADSISWNETYCEFPDGYVSGIDTSLDDGQAHRNGLDELPINFDWGGLDVAEDETIDWKIVNWAKEKLDQDYDQPFFLGIGLYRPHLPWYLPQAYFDRYPVDDITLPRIAR